MCIQAKDTIVYQGKKQIVSCVKNKEGRGGTLSPLYPLKNRLGVSLTPVQAHTGNYRGFTCGWEIIDNQLYLTQFSSSSFRIYTWEQFLGKSPPDDENAYGQQNHFPSDDVMCKADWFSGIIVVRTYRTQNENEHNGWDLEFENGQLIQKTLRYVWSPKRLKDYIDD